MMRYSSRTEEGGINYGKTLLDDLGPEAGSDIQP